LTAAPTKDFLFSLVVEIGGKNRQGRENKDSGKRQNVSHNTTIQPPGGEEGQLGTREIEIEREGGRYTCIGETACFTLLA